MPDTTLSPAVRQKCLLLLAYDLVNGEPELVVDSDRFKNQAWDRFGVTTRVQRQDLLALSRQRLVRIAGSAFGRPDIAITQRGIEAAQEFQIDQRREPKRFQAACNDLLDWLYVEPTAKAQGIEIDEFLAESVGHLGLKYSAPEVHDALNWLVVEGFVAEGSKPSLKRLTRQGFDSIESGISVNEYFAAVRADRATYPS
ncbi:hypothetical protein [Arthrobacter sp. B1I2]|uniref:hypothetical protein n=1 Tax=Arthrobacter sp. B1I2 TaxID=3042263 RepID=UPI00278AE2AC|nr:hypothetical protein [Arthrobacter sp. B1I2]MDQ0733084.1 hypothetical protein [Arthrobacter sp. B1I2]